MYKIILKKLNNLCLLLLFDMILNHQKNESYFLIRERNQKNHFSENRLLNKSKMI